MSALNFHDYALRLHPADNVAVLKRSLQSGVTLANREVRLTTAQPIPAGHKVALAEIAPDAPVLKYGQIIGFARGRIAPGEHVHTHNVVVKAFARDHPFGADVRPVDFHPAEQMRYFPGYARAGGRVGTRNYVAVISSVNCSASVARYVADRFRSDEVRRDFPNVDGVVAFTHKSGCGIQPGEPLAGPPARARRHGPASQYRRLRADRAGLRSEPGASCCAKRTALDRVADRRVGAGVSQYPERRRRAQDGRRPRAAAVARFLPPANALRRTPQPISKLILAEQCGGSDGHSGITANPALGAASDELVRYGGTGRAGGDARDLRRRASADPAGRHRAKSASKLLDRIVRWWEEHVREHHAHHRQQSLPGQQGGRLDHHLREEPRRGRQRRAVAAGRRLSIRRADHDAGFLLHGHARATIR